MTNRYANISTIGKRFSTRNNNQLIYKASKSGQLSVKRHILKQGERLDHIAFNEYGNGNDWWVIAAASGIGWWLQLPPGTVLTIPTNLSQIRDLLGIVT